MDPNARRADKSTGYSCQCPRQRLVSLLRPLSLGVLSESHGRIVANRSASRRTGMPASRRAVAWIPEDHETILHDNGERPQSYRGGSHEQLIDLSAMARPVRPASDQQGPGERDDVCSARADTKPETSRKAGERYVRQLPGQTIL